MEFELCIETLTEALLANRYNFKRVELCSALDLGGLTPSYGLIASCVDAGKTEVHVMIRPRPGGFVYTNDEVFLMQKEILAVGAAGAKGVVFGVLDKDGRVDIQKNSILVELARAKNLQCTFHRAIDISSNWEDDLESIINIGFNRILTSGGQSTALQGIDRIAEMREKAKGQLEIMAGSGIDEEAALKLDRIKVDALHFSARTKVKTMSELGFGARYIANPEKIEKILRHF